MVAVRRSRYPEPEQKQLFSTYALCGAQTVARGGRLVLTLCSDGRRLLRLETGQRDHPWLELMPEDARWLARELAVEPEAVLGDED